MKKFGLLSAVTALAVLNIAPLSVSAESTGLKDSGISYSESVKTINNPSAGYTKTIWAVCKPNNTPVYSPSANLALFFIDIGGFSSGANGTKDSDGNYTEGTDYDLDETFFNSWRTTFENCRKDGSMVALRFRYDANGKENPEPATFEQLMHHIQQIKESGILEEYKDIICFVESGFAGKWGEQHGGKYTSTEYKAKILDAMLDCVPDPIPVTVRTPDIFAKLFSIERSKLNQIDYDSIDSRAKRVGLYDDGYMGSNSDLGTYANREVETEWLGNQTLTSYFGGEFSGDLNFAKQYDTYLPENCIPEMYRTHLSYINSNIFQLYKDYTFGEEYDVEGADNSAYYGQTVYQFIRDHIGYRFVLRKSELSETVKQGGSLDLHFSVENTGFASPIPEQKAQVILEKDGNFMITDIETDSNKWYSCTTSDEELKFRLPDSIGTGDWNVYLKLSNGKNTLGQLDMRSVEFANDGIWNSSLGANYLGTFTVTENENHGTYNRFYQYGLQPDENSDKMYTVTGHTVIDGKITSEYEWTDDMIIAEDGENKLWLNADEGNMYIMTNIDPVAEKAVYNLRVENADNGETYWFYRQSGGWIYYNKGSYDGIVLKTSGNTAEFKIPFGELMGADAGTNLKSVRIFIQDEGNEWKLTGNIQSTACKVPSKAEIYSAPYDIRLSKGDSYTFSVAGSLDGAKYQWCFNGSEIKNATSQTYTLKNADKNSIGKYSVKIETADGVTTEAEIASITEIISPFERKGDSNADTEVNVSDLVTLNKYLLGYGTLTEQGFANSDINGDEKVNVYDFTELRKILVKQL